MKAGTATLVVTLVKDANGQYDETSIEVAVKVHPAPLTAVKYQPWTLPDRVYASGDVDLKPSAPVQIPVLNQGPFTSPVNGSLTIMNAQLASRSNGAVTWRTSAPALLYPSSPGSNLGTLVNYINLDTRARVNGLLLNLEIVQAETDNYLGQTITVQDAIRVVSPTDNGRDKTWRYGEPLPPDLVPLPNGDWLIPEGYPTCGA